MPLPDLREKPSGNEPGPINIFLGFKCIPRWQAGRKPLPPLLKACALFSLKIPFVARYIYLPNHGREWVLDQ